MFRRSGRRIRARPCFRPLAGCGLFPSEREIIAAILVSVPLRGVGCFCDKRCEACQYPEFPSSCGVGVVSYNRHTGRTKWMFPSPCGVWVVSPLRGGPLPPLGFRPLAGCGLFRGRRHSNRGKACFRPLAGCGLFPRGGDDGMAKTVSVPLRGVGCFGKAAHSFWCNRKKNCQLCYFIVSYWQMFINSKLRNCKVPCEVHKTAT